MVEVAVAGKRGRSDQQVGDEDRAPGGEEHSRETKLNSLAPVNRVKRRA
jgi:hypothetical protein